MSNLWTPSPPILLAAASRSALFPFGADSGPGGVLFAAGGAPAIRPVALLHLEITDPAALDPSPPGVSDPAYGRGNIQSTQHTRSAMSAELSPLQSADCGHIGEGPPENIQSTR